MSAPIPPSLAPALFEDLGGTHVQLQIIGVGEGSRATHLRYAVVAASWIPGRAGHYQAQGGRADRRYTPSCSQAGHQPVQLVPRTAEHKIGRDQRHELRGSH
jgi:hypothetical protein